MSADTQAGHPNPGLKRALNLPLMVLYGLGVTIGAGIYVLVGATASIAGVWAPFAFVLAACVMLPSACTFAELVGRFPVSAGEAAYVRAGFQNSGLALATGLMVVTVGTVSAAAITVGSVGYLQQFVSLPAVLLIPAVALVMGGVAALGVGMSVGFAATLTLIEIVGLVAVIVGGLPLLFDITPLSGSIPPTPEPGGATGITAHGVFLAVLSAGVLAFFAFVGFEDLVNMAEEVERPERTLPWAIFLTLAISTVLYVLVSLVAVSAVPIAELGRSLAPLSLVFERATGWSPAAVSAIAIVATLNGVIVQIIMAARVLYGLANQGQLPSVLGTVNQITRTPVIATALVTAVVVVLAMTAPMRTLAEATSFVTLVIFTLVNAALLRIKWRGDPAPVGTFMVPAWVPIVGVASCAVFLGASAL